MRGRSSRRAKESEKNKQAKEGDQPQPHLSGAYIRSLVKQLTSSKPKTDPSSTPQSPPKEIMDEPTSQPNPQPPKKQVRRRLHTSRPYQERLLNMAEARREIVAALKFHRATMKQANQQQQQQHPLYHHQHQQQQPQQLQYSNPIESLNSNFHSSYPCNFYCYPSFSVPSFPWSTDIHDSSSTTFNFPLPNQPLGLNLSIQDFNNIDINSFQYYNITNNETSSNSTIPSVSSSSYLSSPSPCTEAGAAVLPGSPPVPSGGMHHAMDDREMAEIRSIGEQHEMEWNDKVNLVTSAWWFKFLKTMESGEEEGLGVDQDHGFPMVDDFMADIPAWLSDGGPTTTFETQYTSDNLLQQHHDNQLFDHDLPSLDIGEIESTYEDWLS